MVCDSIYCIVCYIYYIYYIIIELLCDDIALFIVLATMVMDFLSDANQIQNESCS